MECCICLEQATHEMKCSTCMSSVVCHDCFTSIETNTSKEYIYGDKKHIYKCVYNRKFKLWSPISIVDEPISNITEVKCIEK